MIVLGIETSCDETAAAVVADGSTILSSVVASQVPFHHPFGGVVPELASRKHIEAIVPVVREAIASSGRGQDRIEAVAVTQGPGLIGSLLVGFSFAKAYAFARSIPWVGVDHLMGHINALFLAPDPPPFPFVALLVSGGHTGLYHVLSRTGMHLLGQTRDDAAGEAFDKVAKMLGLGYPGGIEIDRIAREGNPAKFRFPRSYLQKDGNPTFDFSFSGIKTAVQRHIKSFPDRVREQLPDVVASFQEAVVEVLVEKLMAAAAEKGCSDAALVGGVAANTRLREAAFRSGVERGVRIHIPPASLCGDNAAMIAALGDSLLREGKVSDLKEDVYSRAPQ